MLKTSIPHVYLVGFQAEETFHRGYMIVEYCQTPEQAIEKTKEKLTETYGQTKIKDYRYAIK